MGRFLLKHAPGLAPTGQASSASAAGWASGAKRPAQLSIAQDGCRRTGPYGLSWIVMFPLPRLDVANGPTGQEGGVIEVGVRVKPIRSGSCPWPGLPLSVT